MHPLIERRSPEDATLAALAVAGLSAASIFGVCFLLCPPTGWASDGPFVATCTWLWKLARASVEVGLSNSRAAFVSASLKELLDSLVRYDLIAPLVKRIALVIFTTSAAALASWSYIYRRTPAYPDVDHAAGRRLFKGVNAIRMARLGAAELRGLSADGISIAPGIPIPARIEVLHKMILGAVGSGKTILFRWLIEQYQKRDARMIIHDCKGEYVEGFPSDDFVLLAPHHADSWAWDIAADLHTEQDAREFAARLIPQSHDPMWSSAGREVLAGLITVLALTKGSAWGWRDLEQLVFSSPAEIENALRLHHLPGSRFVEIDSGTETLTRTSFGILTTVWASAAAVLRPLAAAWGDAPSARRISMTRWLRGEGSSTVIIQRSSAFPALSTAWIGAFFDLVGGFVAGPTFPDSDNRLVLVLDELVQLGYLKTLSQIMEVGRSKGVVLMIGAQDREQIRTVYADAAAAWMSMVGLKIILKTNGGDSSAWISKVLIGTREVVWRDTPVHVGTAPGKALPQWSRATVPVVSTDHLERKRPAKAAIAEGQGSERWCPLG